MISITVVVTTYNHEKYISQCLEGILKQEFEYPFKVIVGEDCSPDDTRSILREYEKRFPDRIIPVYYEKNVGGGVNFLNLLSKVETEWVAWCEGDDFWTDPLKLKKQAMLLKANKDAVVCFSKAKVLDEKEPSFIRDDWGFPNWFSKAVYSRTHFGMSNYIPTCTVIYKMSAITPMPSFYLDWHLGDWTLHLHALKNGNAVYLNELTACYRIHEGGAWQGQPLYLNYEKNEKLLKFLIGIEESQAMVPSLYSGLFLTQYLLFYLDIKAKNFQKALSRVAGIIDSGFKMSWSYLVFRSLFDIHFKRCRKIIKKFVTDSKRKILTLGQNL